MNDHWLAFLVAMVDVWKRAKRKNERSNGERLKASIIAISLLKWLTLLCFLLAFISIESDFGYSFLSIESEGRLRKPRDKNGGKSWSNEEIIRISMVRKWKLLSDLGRKLRWYIWLLIIWFWLCPISQHPIHTFYFCSWHIPKTDISLVTA